MKANISFSDEHAVSEVVGAMLLILIAVVVFSIIYMYVFPLLFPPAEVNVQLRGYVTDDGIIVIEHIGGESLTHYRTDVRYVNGTLISTATYQNREDPWEIGECNYPLADVYLFTENDTVRVTICNIDKDGNERSVFDGILTGKGGGTPPVTYPMLFMLISSLRTNTTDEDIICFNYLIDPDVNASTYIYNWKVGGNPFAEILMPFDTEDNVTAKDYSGNGNNGTIIGAAWMSEGIVGGAYYFDGGSDKISLNLPGALEDVGNNDFTISIWIKSDDITADQRVVLEGGKHKNFALMFQFGTEIHFGVCDNGVQHSVRTENLTSNTWYHIAGVWDASENSLEIYCNGMISTETGNRTYAQGVQDGFDLGHGTASSRFWLGSIDELQVYDCVLSGDQIYQIYLSTKDGYSNERVIVSEETSPGDIWQCIVTPNDGAQDDTPVASNFLEIIEYGGGE